jgi:signal transduction histidine kinase
LRFVGKGSGMARTTRFVAGWDRLCGSIPISARKRRVRNLSTLPAPRLAAFFAFLILLSVVFGGCGRLDNALGHNQPVIKFTRVPLAGADDPGKTGEISGQVIGAEPGLQIVLYSKAVAAWWVQPFANEPFTRIRPDSTWDSRIHPGSEYAALLVGPAFQPPATTAVLPTDGVFAMAVAQGELPFWLRWWFPLACVGVGLMAILAFYRLRLLHTTKNMNLRFEERLAERMRVAQELHDTLLQGMISASMQLDVAMDHLPPESPVQPSLRHIMQIMDQVIEEGRTTLRGLRSSTEGAHDMELAFLRVPEDLGVNHKIAYRVLVEGTPLPLQPAIHAEVYSIGREALVNAFRHSGASDIEVELEYMPSRMRVSVRDNGRGIKPDVLRTGRDGHWGLSGMRERAERIGAKFKIMSGPSAGTEVELSVPGHIVFQVPPSNGRWGWFGWPKLRRAKDETPKVESEIVK